MREIVARRSALNEERAEIEKEIAAADRELEQAESRHEDVTMPRNRTPEPLGSSG